MFSAAPRALLATLIPSAVLAQAIPVTGDPVPGLGAFDQAMLTNIAKHGIPGATLGVARDGRLVYLRGFGYSDKDAGTPVQPDAVFRIASVTKPVTATAIVKLIEQGKLTLGSKAFTILSSLQPPAGSSVDPRLAQITVQHLLEHKAGWDNAQIGFDPMFNVVTAAQAVGVTPPATCETVIRYMMSKPLSYTPGTSASYSNFGYCVLGRIVEEVSGQSLDTFVRTQVMAPVGAANTRVGGTLQSEKFAGEVNYYMEAGSGLASSVFPPHSLVPWPYGGFYLQAHNGGGGLVSNTQDLLKYLNSMAGFRLPSAILSSPPAGFVGYIPPRGAGWGWIFHGSLDGNQSSLILDGKTTICWLSNIRHNNMPLNDVLFSDFDSALTNAAKAVSTWPAGDLFSGTPACAYSLNPGAAAFGPTGGSAGISVTAASNCAWTASSNAAWVTIASGAAGNGNGTVSYTVQANATASSRTATVTIAGNAFQITQDPCGQGTCPVVCAISLNPGSANFGPTGGPANVSVTIPASCAWTASSNAAWVTIDSGASGTGNGTVSYSLQPNGAPSSRAATLTIGGTAFQVSQTACGAGTCGSVAPGIAAPSPGQTINVSGVGFQWTAVSGAGYGLRITRAGTVVFEGTLAGSASTSTLVSLPDGAYVFSVRSCWAQPFTAANCGAFSTVSFSVAQTAPAAAPSITSPSPGQNFTTSTQTFSWTSVPNVNRYQVELRDQANGGKLELSLANSGAPPATGTIYSMHASANYALRVRACQSACGPWSATVNFAVTLPPVPVAAPPAPACSLTGNRLNCAWTSVANADFYTVHAIHPSAFNGGPLTVASRRTVALTTANPEPAMPVPDGPLSILVAGCNGNGCGPYSAAASVNATAGNPAAPGLGNPVSGSVLSANPVFFSWNRIPGDNGSNTVYRLYVQDFSRGAPALDILTTSNFHAAAFLGEGSRYDAVVVANPDTASQVIGPASGFVVTAASPASPTMVQPRHQAPGVTAAIASGNVTLGWTPVPGATLYEYFVAVQGQANAAARGVTPGLLVQVPLTVSSVTTFNGIVRACPAGTACTFGSDAGWGPWSNSPGGAGITSFNVTP